MHLMVSLIIVAKLPFLISPTGPHNVWSNIVFIHVLVRGGSSPFERLNCMGQVEGPAIDGLEAFLSKEI